MSVILSYKMQHLKPGAKSYNVIAFSLGRKFGHTFDVPNNIFPPKPFKL